MTQQDEAGQYPESRPNWLELLLLGLIIALAMLLTLPGVREGHMITASPWVLGNVLHWLRETALDTSFTAYPTLQANVLTAIIAGGSALGTVLGLWTVPEAYARLADYRIFLPWMGYLSMAFGTVGLVATWLIGRRLSGPGVGLLATALLGLSPSFNRYCHEGVPDGAAAGLAAVAMLFLISAVRTPSPRNYALAGLFIGLGIATKYNVAVIGVVAVVMHLYLWRNGKVKLLDGRLLWATMACVMAFALTSFQVLIEPREFLYDIFVKVHDYKTMAYATGLGARNFIPYWSHLKSVVSQERGIVFLFLVGLIWGTVRRTPERTMLLLSALLTFIYVGRWRMALTRFELAAYPALAVLAALCVVETAALLRQRKQTWGPIAAAGIIAVTLLLVGHSATAVVTQALIFSKPSTALVTQHWIEANLAPGSVIAGPNTPEAYPRLLRQSDVERYVHDSDLIPDRLRAEVWSITAKWPAYNLRALTFMHVQPTWPKDWPPDIIALYETSPYARQVAQKDVSLAILQQRGVQYIVTSSHYTEAYLEASDAHVYGPYDPRAIHHGNFRAFYERTERVAHQDAKDSALALLKTIAPEPGRTQGIVFHIFRLSGASATKLPDETS